MLLVFGVNGSKCPMSSCGSIFTTSDDGNGTLCQSLAKIVRFVCCDEVNPCSVTYGKCKPIVSILGLKGNCTVLVHHFQKQATDYLNFLSSNTSAEVSPLAFEEFL